MEPIADTPTGSTQNVGGTNQLHQRDDWLHQLRNRTSQLALLKTKNVSAFENQKTLDESIN